MKANNYISNKENKLLLIVAFTALIFVSSVISLQVVKNYNYSAAEKQRELKNQANDESSLSFSVDGIETQLPLLHLLTIFIFVVLLKTKRFLFPFLLTVFYFLVFISGLSSRYENSILASPNIKISLVKKICLVANIFDYIAFLFISILLFWQISILLRMLVKTLQKEKALP